MNEEIIGIDHFLFLQGILNIQYHQSGEYTAIHYCDHKENSQTGNVHISRPQSWLTVFFCISCAFRREVMNLPEKVDMENIFLFRSILDAAVHRDLKYYKHLAILLKAMISLNINRDFPRFSKVVQEFKIPATSPEP